MSAAQQAGYARQAGQVSQGQQAGQASQGQQAGQPAYAQQGGQAAYGQQAGARQGMAGQGSFGRQAGAGGRGGRGQRVPGGDGGGPGKAGVEGMRARLVGALVLVVAALATTGISVGWIWTKADAVTPVALPQGGQTPMETVDPPAKPSETPTPTGKVLGTEMRAGNGDMMPVMSSAWTGEYDRTGLWGGTAVWFTVHANYDGKKNSWGNLVTFGQLAPTIKYVNTAAGRKEAASQAGSRAVINLYDKNAKISAVTHKPITVDGHPGHEITARIAVNQPPLKETFSMIMIAVIDRGDNKTAAVSIADIAGSTPAWQNVWRYKVSQIKISQ
ncbi:hypothetical protein [Kribbella sp. NPDC050470]|uniref:hypothetical protein n=1 Tax=unclassified Kribbella TaxID=2644121 RepID=UPI00379CE3E2